MVTVPILGSLVRWIPRLALDDLLYFPALVLPYVVGGAILAYVAFASNVFLGRRLSLRRQDQH